MRKKSMLRLWTAVAVPLILAAPLALFAGGCADDACADGTCESDRGPIQGPGDEPDEPFPCGAACEALLEHCASAADGDDDPVGDLRACIEWCQRGGLSEHEATCLASIVCGENPDDCLE